ncbi:MAG: ATPase, T2SS/T4P/T4SS family [Myxococcota bacterium]
MFQVTINEKGGQGRQESFDKAEITIGRVQGNDIILPKGNISKRHSRIVLKDGKFIIVDLKSTNGTYVNGKKITAPQVVKATDKIYIGDFTLQLASQNGAVVPEPRDAGLRARSATKDEEIDLFGGDAPLGLDDSSAGPSNEPAAPGLIDDNFDQEFDAPAAEPQSKLPRPAKRTSPEPDGALNNSFDDADLDALSASPDPEPEPKPTGLPRPQKASTRGGPSRIRPIPGRSKPEPKEELAAEVLIPDPPSIEGPTAAPTLKPAPQVEAEPAPAPAPLPASAMPVVAAAGAAEFLSRSDALNDIHTEVADTLALRGRLLAELPGLETHAVNEARSIAERMVSAGLLSPAEDLQALAEEVGARATGIEPLLDLLENQQVVEIAINHDGQIMADRDGRLEMVNRRLASEAQVHRVIQTLAVLAGVSPDEVLIDGRLRDGTRVVGALPPLSFRGPTLSLRKTTRDFFTLDKLLEYNTVSMAMMTFLDHCVRCRTNMLLSVGPGVNATATLNALLAQMPSDDRVVTIERGVELHVVPPRNLVTLEPQGGVPLSALLGHAVALQADRAVLGDVSGMDIESALASIEGPLQGSVLAYPGSNPRDTMEKIAASVSNDEGIGIDDARRVVAQALPVVMHEARFLDNSRRITVISEAIFENGDLRLEDIFTFKAEGVDENLIVTGTFRATGYTPRFLEDLVERGEAEVNMDIFKA